MSNLVFPDVIPPAWGFGKTPEDAVIVQSGPNRAETRITQTHNPIWHWEPKYTLLLDDPNNIRGSLTYTDLRTMAGFFLRVHGRFDDFLYSDRDDNAVVAQTLALVNDGAGNYYSPIQRDFGGFLEDVTDLNPYFQAGLPSGTYQPQMIVVQANGVTKTQDVLGTPHDYSVIGPGLAIPGYSYRGLVIKWHITPTAPITASFLFYFRVRFEMPKQAF